MTNGTKKLQRLVLGVTLITALAACTKPRPADINDDELKLQIFAISELQGKEYNIQTGAALQSQSDSQDETHALTQKPQVEIKSSNAPARLQNIFDSLPVSAQSGQTYPVRLAVDAKSVTLFRVVSNLNELTDIEKTSMIQQTVRVGSSTQQLNLVPMAQMAVKDYGTLCRAKNDYGEETSNLKICHTDFKSATHVQISLKSDDLTAALGQHELDQVFLKDRLNGKVTTLSTLQQQMKFSLYPISDEKVVTYVSTDAGSQVNLLVYKIAKRSQIKDDKILQQLNSNLKLGKVAQCPKEVLSTLSAAEQKDCVLMLAYTLKGDAVRAETQTKDDLGRPGVKVELKKTASTTSNLVQFDEAVPATVVDPKDLTQLNPYNTIRLSDIMNKEFMMRRTFEDAASTLTGFGPGASGYMDLVRFELQDKALVVRRVLTVNGARDATNIDKEELMSIPVTYKKIDSATSSSVAPRLIDATKNDAQYAFLDWTENKIAASNSPLSFANDGPETCFKSTSRQDVTDLDNRIQNGVLSFSISGSYTFDPSCSTFISLNDYWYGAGMQTNFNIKERISFMVNKGAQDKNPGISIPFVAQNALGYGVFTMDQITPDKYGNRAGTIGTENPMPVIYDFSNEKQLVYHLGGLPEDQSSWEYKALVDGTKEVVADWNQALHRAFAGTSLARNGDYIVLKVDGVDDTAGHLGDLDRSYIWNFTKNMDSGLLGLSQAAPNPRSGRIEQNNVLMYSGNLVAEIGYIRNSVRKQQAYRDWKNKVFAELKKQADPLKDAKNVNLPTDKDGSLEPDPGIGNRELKTVLQNAFRATVQARSGSASRAKQAASALLPLMAGNKALFAKNSQIFGRLQNGISLESILRKVVAQRASRNSEAIQGIVIQELLKSATNLSQEQKQDLALQARRLMLTSEFNKNFSKGPNCITSAEEFEDSFGADPELLQDSEQATADIFKKWYKATLAHEMGHSLGLTHNFEGSLDKANFLFAGETESNTSRNYSSIMDYVPDQYQRYAGPGPYDVRALRVAYTGLIEISPNIQSYIKDDGRGGKALVNGNVVIPLSKNSDDFYYELPLAAYIKNTNLQSWWRMDASVLQKFPVKKYDYCTDKDVGLDPVCNRWDMGTDEVQIVKYYIDQYKNSYATFNTRGDDLIKMPSYHRYLSHLLTDFLGIRPFLEEGFYRAWFADGRYSDDQINTAFTAALEGYKFFTELVSAPTEDLSYTSAARFHLLQNDYEDKGSKGTDQLLVETKAMEDRFVPGSDFEFETRGIESDKSFALLTLTLPGIGGPRYEAHSMGLSYADFEKYILRLPSDGSVLFSLVGGALSENMPSYVFTPHGLAALPINEYHADNSDLFRLRAILSAAVNLENTNPMDDGNYASLFRVSSSQSQVPKDRLVAVKPDQSLTSQTSVKLWAMDNAKIANSLISTVARDRRYADNYQKIGGGLWTIYQAAQEKNAAATNVSAIKKAKLSGNIEKDMQNLTTTTANQATAKLTATATTTTFESKFNKLLADLVSLNKDGALLSAENIASIQDGIKKQENKDLTAEQAQKVYFAQEINEALQYIPSVVSVATQLDGMSEDQRQSPEVQQMINDALDAGARIAARNALIGVAQHQLANMKVALNVDASGAVKDSLPGSINLVVNKDILTRQQGLIMRNLSFLNSLLIQLHPEMNRY